VAPLSSSGSRTRNHDRERDVKQDGFAKFVQKALEGPPVDVEAFIQENDIDQMATKSLRVLTFEKQQVVMAEGPISGANKSAILMSRIRRMHHGELPGTRGGSGRGDHDRWRGGASGQCASPGGQDLRQMGMQAMQQAQMGQLQSSCFLGFPQLPMIGGEMMPQQFPLMPYAMSSQASGMETLPLCVPQGHVNQLLMQQHLMQQQAMLTDAIGSQVELFCAQNSLDATGRQALQGQPLHVQQFAIAEGPLGSGSSSKPAELLDRLRRLSSSAPGLLGMQSGMPLAMDAGIGMGAFPSMSTMQLPMTDVSRAIAMGNALSSLAEPPQAKQGLSRAKQVAAAGGTLAAQIHAFVEENNLDQGAENVLIGKSEDVQRLVLEEGPITGGNCSAILISRIRRIDNGVKSDGQSHRRSSDARREERGENPMSL